MIKNTASNQSNRIFSFLLVLSLVVSVFSFTAPTIVKSDVPSSYDLRDTGYVTSVKNQGSANTCWVFAAIGAIESSLITRGYADSSIDLSEGHLGWFAINSSISNTEDLTYGDGFSVSNPYQYTGNDLYVIWSIARGFGLELEEYVPYNPQYPNSVKVRENERYVSEYTVTSLDIYESNQIDEIKSEIMSNGALMASYKDSSSYYNKSSQGYCFYENISTNTNHAMMIVGWDDNFSKNNFGILKPSSDGAWLCRNSHGESFGDDGYFWLSYETTSLKRIVSFKAQPAFNDVYQIYQYDGYGYSKTLSINESGVFYTSNIFDATENGFIEKVALYSATADTNQEISIYALYDGYTSPTDGSLISTFTVSTPEIGYRLCPLPSPVKITGGSAFSVVIKTTGEGRIKAYSEGPNDRASHSGKSFVSSNGNSWLDTAENGFGNLCIKAWVNPEVYEGPDIENIYNMMIPVSSEYYEDHALSSLLEYSEIILKNGGTEREILNNYLRLEALYDKYTDTVTIENEEQFISFAESVNYGNNFADIVVELKADLDFSHMTYIMPTGFGGVFNGNNHIIKGIELNSSADSGLFGTVLSHGCLSNIIVSDCSFNANNYAGGICTRNNGLIIDCAFKGEVFSNGLEFGGICGINEGEVINCFSECSSDNVYFGSIVGNNCNGKVKTCISTDEKYVSIGNDSTETYNIFLQDNIVLINGKNASIKPLEKFCCIHGDTLASDSDIAYTGLSSEHFTFSVLGDIDGDGVLTTSDYACLKSHFLKRVFFDKAQALASDVNYDREINSTDYILLKSHFLNLDNIYN